MKELKKKIVRGNENNTKPKKNETRICELFWNSGKEGDKSMKDNLEKTGKGNDDNNRKDKNKNN